MFMVWYKGGNRRHNAEAHVVTLRRRRILTTNPHDFRSLARKVVREELSTFVRTSIPREGTPRSAYRRVPRPDIFRPFKIAVEKLLLQRIGQSGP